MALTQKLANVAANAAADAVCDLLDGGFADIYDGTQPATADTAITSQVKLASLGLNATAGGAAAAGVVTLNAITSDSSADASGTATWARLFKSDHTTVVMDMSVGTSGCNVNLNSATVTIAGTVGISAGTFTINKS